MNATLLPDSADRVIAKAWADEDFKTALLADPRAALEAQGIELPGGVTLQVHEDSPNVIHLVLPRLPGMALVGETLGQDGAPACGCGGGGCRCGGGGCACGGCSCGCGGGTCLCVCV